MEATPPIEWPAQWLRGPLAMCVSEVIAVHGPLHGYGITQILEESGLGTIGGGTLYPLLGRLERDDIVTTDWEAGLSGPAKKMYTITADGLQNLAAEKAKWREFTRTTHELLAASPAHSPQTSPQPATHQEESK